MAKSTDNEASTRSSVIDPALARAGWVVDDPQWVGREIPVDGFDPQAWAILRAALQFGEAHSLETLNLPAGITDYSLYRPNGEIIAVVEAKRTSIDPRLAQAQAEFYVSEIEKRQSFRPYAFMTNGRETYFLDAGNANKRRVSAFFSPDDLERLLYLQQNKISLTTAPINSHITDRAYQHEAVRRVCETFEQGKRRALLVMATGTGKTRTAMSLVDVFMRANQARRILFVADRDELVKQALNDGFKEHLPDEPRTRIYTGSVEGSKSNRLFVSTLQTLNMCYEQFTPGFFDLLIFDEVHRSIFNQWNNALHYFDARVIGLTATPADFIERNTFLEFDCADRTPTFLYSYEQAVKDRYLVDYSLRAAQPKFQRKGIKGVDLSEEDRNALLQQGIDPDGIDYEGTELERRVSNKDTLRKQWQEIWDACIKDRGGQLPGKTIVFAMTQEHAQRLADVFEETFPQFPGLARVITYKSNFKGQLIERFKKQDWPRIAITVDLLETGVDVPEAVNLVFMKPVQSRIRLEQMIGRGTRGQATCKHPEWLPESGKSEFLILDFWENNFNKSSDEELAQSLPMLVTIFNTRLKMLEQHLGMPGSAQTQQLIATLRGQIAQIPMDAYAVREAYADVEQAWQDAYWNYITRDKIDFLRLKVGPLLRFVPGVDVEAATFTSKVERLKLQILTGKDTAATAQSIAEDASRLPDFVFQDPNLRPLVERCLSPNLRSATVEDLNAVMAGLAPQIRNRRNRPNTFVTLDLPDYVALSGYILLQGGTEHVYVEEYRKRIDQRMLQMIDEHPTMKAIAEGREVSDLQLLDLERTLQRELAAGDVELTESNVRKAYGMKVGSLLEFLRALLEIEGIPGYADIVRRQFDDYIGQHTFSADQILFLRTVQTVLSKKRRIGWATLYEPPLTQFGMNAVNRLFKEAQIDNLLRFTEKLAMR